MTRELFRGRSPWIMNAPQIKLPGASPPVSRLKRARATNDDVRRVCFKIIPNLSFLAALILMLSRSLTRWQRTNTRAKHEIYAPSFIVCRFASRSPAGGPHVFFIRSRARVLCEISWINKWLVASKCHGACKINFSYAINIFFYI